MTGQHPTSGTAAPRGPRLSRRGLLAAGGLGMLAAGAAACTRSANASLIAPQLPSGPPLLVGASLELTGTGSIVGQSQKKALSMAIDRLNMGGVVVGNTVRKVNLDLQDNGSEPATAAKQTGSLIGRGAVAIIGGGTARTSMSMAVVAEKAGTPMLSTSAADSIINAPSILERRFVFKLGPNATDVAQFVLGLTTSAQRIGLLFENSPHGTDGQSQLQQAVSLAGMPPMVSAPVNIGADSYLTEAARMVAANPDVIVIWAVSPTSGLVAQAVRRAGFTGTIIFDSGAASEDSLSRANRQVAGTEPNSGKVFLITPRVMGGIQIAATTPQAFAQKDFLDAYTRLYGTFSGLAVYAADALNLIAAALTRAGSASRLRVRDELEATPYDGIAGEYLFSTISHGGVDADALTVFQLSRSLGWVATS